jgi:hypothetical protein
LSALPVFQLLERQAIPQTCITMTPPPQIVSGEIDFYILAIDKVCKTWYIFNGDIKDHRPLICAHGGPARVMHT